LIGASVDNLVCDSFAHFTLRHTNLKTPMVFGLADLLPSN